MGIVKNKNWLSVTTFFALCFAALSTAHAASRQDIQQLRTLSYSVVDNVLLYHNPNGTPYQLNNAEAYQRDLQRLLQLSAQLGLTDVTARAKQLESAITDLKHLPKSAADIRDTLPPYSSWLPQVLEQHSELTSVLAELYARQPATSELQQELHTLSQDIARLSLSYQLDAFINLVAEQWLLDRQTVNEIDASVLERFANLSAHESELSGKMEKLRGRYLFVRGYLLKPGQDWAPSAVERYLLSTARDLDSVAAVLTP